MTQLLDTRATSPSAEGLVMNVANSSDGSEPHLTQPLPQPAASPSKTSPVASTSAVPTLSNEAITALANVFKLLADETRLKILALLTEKDEFHVRALCDLLGQSQPAVSHHLALLRVAGLIDCRREGKHNFYRVLPERVQEILDGMFAGVAEGSRRVRFENYVLMFSPPVRQ